ncbi:MAG TPA: phytoene/squalene synthase family protein [bacterium]|nr:phytoene/squalene synthase family protein [bacterium]
MAHNATKGKIFLKGSKTYFTSSIFFPPQVRADVFTLYAFLRVADDLVDCIPQRADEFYEMRRKWRIACTGTPAHDPVIDDFVALAERIGFEPEWTEAFFHSMELDLAKKEYNTLPETLEYVYGSAEVIGLYMMCIMGLPPESEHPARMLGRAMQYINFIRDINEDIGLGRRYLPLRDSLLTSLLPDETHKKPDAFRRFITEEIERYLGWQKEAEAGFCYLPRRYRIPVATASDMYAWTAATIRRDPFVVYERKVKPSRLRIVANIIRRFAAIRECP